MQAPQSRWYLKRMNPPRLAPGAAGYYYNFCTDVIADDPSHIMTKTHEQKAIMLLQTAIRGALVRRQIKKETKAVTVIQCSKRMWDVQKVQGKNGQNANILKSWYRKFEAMEERRKLEDRVTKFQAIFRGRKVRKLFRDQYASATGFQASYRGIRCRRHFRVFHRAMARIQRTARGRHYGRKPMSEMRRSAAKIQAHVRGGMLRVQCRQRIQAAIQVQAHYRGLRSRKLVNQRQSCALMIQRNWRRFQAQIDVKVQIYERLEDLRLQRIHMLREKLEHGAATMLQRNYRSHRDFKRFFLHKRQKAEADKATGSLLVALFAGAGQLRHQVHPWWRHLPLEVQDTLEQIKASMQRTIALVPCVGKLANEEIGRRGLRVAHVSNFVYDQNQVGQEPDLASHMLLCVARHLLMHVSASIFPRTVQWGCYEAAHIAVSLVKTAPFVNYALPVGKEIEAHPGDTLHRFWDEMDVRAKDTHDTYIKVPKESYTMLFLQGLSPDLRSVFFTAETLITMRQALDAPTLSTNDHLRFQGLDEHAASQLLAVLSSELEHSMPKDWASQHGTVSALASAMVAHLAELRDEEEVREKPVPKSKAKSKAKASTKPRAQPKETARPVPESPANLKRSGTAETVSSEATQMADDLGDLGGLCSFNRNALLRVVQQVRFLMCDQDKLMKRVLGVHDADAEIGMRQSRYIAVTDKLYEIAELQKHDHCPFVLSVVLFHVILRALMLRVVYHRAAIAIQKRYRYRKLKEAKSGKSAPTIRIQRFWRGLQAALRVFRMDDAAFRIQRCYQRHKWRQRSNQLKKAARRIQRVATGAVQRLWIRQCHKAATIVQKHCRGLLVRVVLDKAGRDLVQRIREEQVALIDAKPGMPLSTFCARRASLAGDAQALLAQHRKRSLQRIRMSTTQEKQAGFGMEKSRRLQMRGAVQPARASVFEPMTFALARLYPQRPTVAGQSKILKQVTTIKHDVDKSLRGLVSSRRPHAGARRGRNAVLARQLARTLGPGEERAPEVDDMRLRKWAGSVLGF
jgi:hypothetical protein